MSVRKLMNGSRRLAAGSACCLSFVLPLGSGVALGAHKAEEPLTGAGNSVAEQSPRPKAPVFESPISGFKPYVDIDSPEWKAANDRVGEIGGWRVYAREAFESPEPETAGNESADGADSK